MLSRYDLMILMVQSVCIITDIKSGHSKIIQALQDLQDANIKNKIDMGTDETVAKKAMDYCNWVYGLGPKPFWFVRDDEGNPDGKTTDPLHSLK